MVKKVKELLESGAISQETADALTAEWKSHTKVLNDENKTLRSENETLSNSYDEVLKSKGDLDQELAGLDDKIAQAKRDGQAEIQKQLQDERDSKSELQKSLSALEKANTGLKLDGIVTKEFKEYNVLDTSKRATEYMLRSMVSVNDKGEAIFTDGDQVSSVSDGFKAYFETNTDQLKPQGDPNGGSGAGGNGGSNNVADTKGLSPSQMMAKGREQTSR